MSSDVVVSDQSRPNTAIRSTPMDRLREPRNAALVGLLIAAAIVVLFLLLKNNDNGNSEPAATNGPEGVTVQGLHDLASSADHPVYWAGERPGQRYELTITDQGNIFVRYL